MIEELRTDLFHLHYKSDIVESTLLWENHCHAKYEMIAVLNGSIVVTVEGRDVKLRQGEAIVIPPLRYHGIRADENGNYRRLTVLFNENAIPAMLKDTLAEQTPAPCLISPHLRAELQRVCREENKDFFGPLANSLMVQALYELSHTSPKTANRESNGTLSEILSYIDAHLGEMVTLDHIAAHLSRSKSSVCHLFQERMKISPKQYILQKKLAIAHHQIQNGVAPTEVASKLGYENYSNFYRLYKKHLGAAPAEDLPNDPLTEARE